MIEPKLEDQGSEIAGVEFGWRIRMQFLCRIVTVPEDQASRFKRQDAGCIEFVAADTSPVKTREVGLTGDLTSWNLLPRRSRSPPPDQARGSIMPFDSF